MEIAVEQFIVGDFLHAASHDVDKDMTVARGQSLQNSAARKRVVVATAGRGGEETKTRTVLFPVLRNTF